MRPEGSSADTSQSLRSTTAGIEAGVNAVATGAAGRVPVGGAVGSGAPLALPARAATTAKYPTRVRMS